MIKTSLPAAPRRASATRMGDYTGNLPGQKIRMMFYLLTVFAKNERDDLTQRERNDLAKLVRILVDTAKEKST